MSVLLVNANAVNIPLANESVQCVVTSPPYYGLRDYGTAAWIGGNLECDHQYQKGGRDPKTSKVQLSNGGTLFSQYERVCKKCGARRVDNQIGLEETPEQYVSKLIAVFREVWRVLKNDGTLWLNLGDSYASDSKTGGRNDTDKMYPGSPEGLRSKQSRKINHGCKPKDLLGIPWLVAFALRGEGWYLRSDIIWHKPNPMPESVTDRPTKSHEYIFLLSKSDRYFYDAEAIKEPSIDNESYTGRRLRNAQTITKFDLKNHKFAGSLNDDGTYRSGQIYETRNRRSVWTVATQPYSGAHFATFPPQLIEPCIKAGSKKGDIILDPFAGSGTTMQVARRLERHSVGCDLSLSYLRECAIPRLQLNHDEFYNGKKASGIIEDLPLFSKMP